MNKILGNVGLICAALVCLSIVQIKALEIALSGSQGSGTGGGRIGVVDMQKIYQLSPQTVNSKEDYMRRLEQKKIFLAEKEKDLENIKTRLSVLETTMKIAPDAEPPEEWAHIEAGATPQKSLEGLKAELKEKETAYQEARKQAMDDLAAFEKQQNQVIFGRIYSALQELAKEEQVTIIVDKASVLFGSAEVDLTEKLQIRVRGF
jgi:Skp family chaperone for outer membrane proteins